MTVAMLRRIASRWSEAESHGGKEGKEKKKKDKRGKERRKENMNKEKMNYLNF
jgi:hypothetical protein